MRVWRLCIALVVAVVMMGCPGALYVNEVIPHPNIDLPQQRTRLGLALGDDVPDGYELPEQNGVRQVFVRRWRASLEHGFHSAFADVFTIDNAHPSLVLQLPEAHLEFGHTAMGLTAIVRYKARIVDAESGAIKARRSGEALSKTGGHTNDATPLARSAIESLYETLAKDLLAAAEDDTSK